MKIIVVNGESYKVEVIYKRNNKKTYMRVKDGVIVITTPIKMSENYIKNHFDDIKKYENIIENRLCDDCTIENLIKDNLKVLEQVKKHNVNYIF